MPPSSRIVCCSIAGCIKGLLGFDRCWWWCRCFCRDMSIGSTRLLIGIASECERAACVFPSPAAIREKNGIHVNLIEFNRLNRKLTVKTEVKD